MATGTYSPGLEGVIAGTTSLSEIDIEKSRLVYRGYDVHDLAEKGCFEETAYLLFYGELPTRQQLTEFQERLAQERSVPSYVYEVLRQTPREAHPMDRLKVAVSALAPSDPDYNADPTDREANLRKATRLTAKMGNLVANSWRIANGQEVIEPHPKLHTAANFLYMLFGKEPDDLNTKTLDTSLVLYAEHGYNASTFAARVTVSTLSDIYSGVVSAIGALKGPLHGGANEKAMEMLMEIGSPERAEPYIKEALAQKKKIMGFGHREYKISDSRAGIMSEMGHRIAEQKGDKRWVEIADIVERVMKQEKNLFPNVDFPAAYTYYLMGIPIPLYTPIFAVSRITGWTAHIIEQLDNNRIIRPKCLYEGPAPRPYIPIDQRS
jgi:2-methylcitrate synthase/citrate synthase II